MIVPIVAMFDSVCPGHGRQLPVEPPDRLYPWIAPSLSLICVRYNRSHFVCQHCKRVLTPRYDPCNWSAVNLYIHSRKLMVEVMSSYNHLFPTQAAHLAEQSRVDCHIALTQEVKL